MTEAELSTLKFPIGQFQKPALITSDHLEKWKLRIAEFPQMVENTIAGKQKCFHWKYRPEGWNIAQVIHHCADSHMNSYIRFKLALTEDEPAIRPYHEDRWAELEDGISLDVTSSLQLLTGLHSRWIVLLESLTEMS